MDGGHPGGRRTGGHPGGRRTGGRYTTDGHTFLRYGGREDTEGAPTWRQGRRINTAVLFFWCLLHDVFFFRKNMFCSTEDFRVQGSQSLFRKLFILCLYAEILLKSRVCLKDTPPKLKASLSRALCTVT